MTQRRLMISAALASLAIGCGTSDNGTPIGTGGDGGTWVLADGAVVPNAAWDGGQIPGTVPPPGVVVVNGEGEYNFDGTAAAGVPGPVLDTLRNAAAAAGAPGGEAGGGNANPSSCADLLYPYDNTTMPGGMISPPFMFQNGWDAAYVRVGYQGDGSVDYQFAAGTATPGELRIPAEEWANVVARTPNLPLTFTFAFSRGGQTSTCVTRMRVAKGNMTGSIYYNTYNSPDASGVGAVLRLTLGQNKPETYLREPFGVPPTGPCVGCHSVSADGTRLAASQHLYGTGPTFFARSFPVGQTLQPMWTADVQDAAFGGITPRGEAILRIGNPECTQNAHAFPRSRNNFPLSKGPTKAGLIDMATGMELPSTGLAADRFYWMPQFSPDGLRVVFNDARMGPNGVVRTDLGVADYNPTTRTFSNQRVLTTASALGAPVPSADYNPGIIALAAAAEFIPGNAVQGTNNCSDNTWEGDPSHVGASKATVCTGPCYPAWPFFTPDGKGVIFSMISVPDFAVAFPGRDQASKSELWYADVASGKAVRLDNANRSPGGDGLDNYYPTVLPVQVGGYYWLFWTSTRKFGFRDTSGGPLAAVGDGVFGSTSSSEAFKKRIWVSAIQPPLAGEFTTDVVKDPSLPPFYLEGQSDTGNTRAFAALNPCKDRGAECASGLDCCTGFCNIDKATGKGVCGDKKLCAEYNERCNVADDCCPPASPTDEKLDCIGGFCGVILR
jgi:hypothetical protein